MYVNFFKFLTKEKHLIYLVLKTRYNLKYFYFLYFIGYIYKNINETVFNLFFKIGKSVQLFTSSSFLKK